MAEHTPGPLRHIAVAGGWDGLSDERGSTICKLSLNVPANAHRLTACWNACHDAGLSTEALEDGVVQKLVAACTVAHDYEAIPCEEFERKYGPMGLDDVLAMLSAAITKARRGAS